MVMQQRGPGIANRLTPADVTKLKAETSYLKAISGVTRGSFNVVGGTTTDNSEGYYSTDVQGVEPDYLVIKEWGVSDGEFFTDADVQSPRQGGRARPDRGQGALRVDDSPLGQTIRIKTTPFKIVGVLAKKGATGMGDDQD